MPSIDVADEMFVVTDPASLAQRLADPHVWQRWWRRLDLTVFMDRGIKGTRWSVTGELHGSMEWWLDPWHDGVILHWYLRADPYRAGESAERLRERYVLAYKWHANALKDAVEAGRSPGEPRIPAAG